MRLKILCDTSADLVLYPNQPLYEKFNIDILPMKVYFDENEVFLEQKNLNNIQFYELIKLYENQPKTAPPSTEDFYKTFQKNGREYNEILSLHISKDLSHTYFNAIEAKKRYLKSESNPAKINVVHSGVAGLALGMIVLKAVELSQKQLETTELMRELYNWKEKNVKASLTVRDLNWLYEGGRLSRSQKTIGNLLNKKPVLTFDYGKINVVGYTTGLERTLQYMVKYLLSQMDDEKQKNLTLSFVTARNFDLIDDFIRFIEKAFPKLNIGHKFELGATITSHTGMDTIGFVLTRDLNLKSLLK